MVLLILGLILWTALHYMRAATPALRDRLQESLGNGSKGLIGVGIILSVVLMYFGYSRSDFVAVWYPPSFLGHVNNLLMLLAFYIYFITATKPGAAWLFGGLKNPQLTGFKVWAVAHLLANGDLSSIVLFGGLLAWAVGQVILSKRAPSLVDRSKAPISNPLVHLGLVAAAFVGVGLIHMWVGVNPFGGV